ncbi:tripartite tricarboxylate transporter TctB family protein [Falsochrobactrum sp. TDYN1]|uniref:Tripartite tricarboxylate transporter TctB family protein n=1 Tax=Falsochrobactrum tianjinense TaxID=2706015 RepID=A0A949UV10_9HYPH|nr:tripartite tricarboxylate transporter TctB family protein [Falsochrobactrum sp. TDYN1]MBV2143623.1 tripartite tricarboxylate transporter TctB family protein [Falsochrobactrum sp. TDYN1]
MAVKRFHVEIATAIGTGMLGIAGLIGATELGFSWEKSGPEAGYFPFYISLILITASLWNLGAAIFRLNAGREAARELAETFLDREQFRRVAVFLCEMVAFVTLTLLMGLYFSSALYIGWTAWRHGGYRLLTAIGISVSFTAAQYVLFEIAFLVPLKKGPIESWLGIY